MLCAICLFSSAVCGAEAPVTDEWMTKDLQSSFLLTGWVDASRLSVATSHGVVHLSGVAANATERALAIELARNVRGVKAVDTSGLQP